MKADSHEVLSPASGPEILHLLIGDDKPGSVVDLTLKRASEETRKEKKRKEKGKEKYLGAAKQEEMAAKQLMQKRLEDEAKQFQSMQKGGVFCLCVCGCVQNAGGILIPTARW